MRPRAKAITQAPANLNQPQPQPQPQTPTTSWVAATRSIYFTLASFVAKMDGNLVPKVLETKFPIKLRYVGPYFYANATVKCAIPSHGKYEVGFIQQCDSISLVHRYPNHYTQWEMPTPLSDSNGKQYPWYIIGTPNQGGACSSTDPTRVVLQGPTPANHQVSLSMNDNLCSNVQWWDPVPPGRDNYDASYAEELTGIERKQAFTLWLVARPENGKQFDILRVVQWQMHFKIDVDCTKPKNSRCTATNVDSKILVDRDGRKSDTIPAGSLVAPNANDAQELIGYNNANVRQRKIMW
jgi:hypothetical protein